MIYNSETKYKAIKAVESGAALRVATAKLGVSAETVRRWCKAVGSSFTVGLMGGAVLPRTQKPKSESSRLNLQHRLFISAGILKHMTHA